MDEKIKAYVAKVVGIQLGHNPELKSTLFKNSVDSPNTLIEDLGCEEGDITEIALQIADDLCNKEIYYEILRCNTVADIESAVEKLHLDATVLEKFLTPAEPEPTTNAEA